MRANGDRSRIPFWSAKETRGRLTRPRIEFFLLQYLTARTGDEVSLIRLFAEYKTFAEGKHGPATVDEEVSDILRFAPHYRNLVAGTGTDSLARLGRRLRHWEVGPRLAPILAIAASEMSETECEAAFDDIVSFVVRRAICGKDSRNYNNVFLGLTKTLWDHGPSAHTVRSYLLAQQGESGVSAWRRGISPCLARKPIYKVLHPVARLRAVLSELELRSRGPKVDPLPLPDDLWIEHLMPQAWWQNWPLKDGTKVSEAEVQQAPLAELLGEPTTERLEKKGRDFASSTPVA